MMKGCVCVIDARGLRASRLNDAETGRGDADRDGHSGTNGMAGEFVTGVTRN